MKPLRRLATVALAALAATVGLAPSALAAPDPVVASPYLYQWGGQTDPAAAMSATGVKAFTLAFMLSGGGCDPKWDGNRALTGSDAALIQKIRSAGGDVIPSFGGWSGTKLGSQCGSPEDLAGAYQKVIDAYGLKAIDLDIENTDEFENATVQDRILNAVKITKQKNPGVRVVITMGTSPQGPTEWGTRLITQAKAIGANVDVWSVMPFDFSDGGDMAAMTKSAVDGLAGQLKSAFGWSDDEAYRHSGLSSMNGKTDNAGENVSVANFTSIRDYASSHHLGRFTFWATNRDCGGGGECSGIDQEKYAFTKIVAGYQG
ncbi:chitinase [Amycolatopsis rhabdoformis]|uniref:Chitinase n=1 Tax=Amycolatopsis rhabdoformis TaxID=1448059 RepID=A0ABZ1I9S2_9PSEU|nr:chitinase [Amycolatopsis rhabdoformis]WSE31229.1 chitinase [Amycolatopsis rhabdoformis]